MIEFDSMKLGSCCNCGREDDTVRCVVTIELRSPEPGNGCWGCLVCGLPQAGAVAVLCDECASVSIEPKNICLGFPSENRRLPFSRLPIEPFCHDAGKHEAEQAEQVPPETMRALRKLAEEIADRMIDKFKETLKAQEALKAIDRHSRN